MQWKIATGEDPFNLLQGPVVSTVGPLAASGAKTNMVSYSASPLPATITVGSASGASIVVGSYIVADLDYTAGTFGTVGAAGIPIQSSTSVTDVDYTRKTSDFVARVTAITTNTVLTLDQPFVGGGSGTVLPAPTSPPAGSQVQVVGGFAAREGATYITEWSGLFIMDTIDSAQIACYYPHLSILQFKDVGAWAIENVGTTDETGYELDCTMNALAFDDPIDGETIVGYKCFYFRPGQAAGI